MFNLKRFLRLLKRIGLNTKGSIVIMRNNTIIDLRMVTEPACNVAVISECIASAAGEKVKVRLKKYC